MAQANTEAGDLHLSFGFRVSVFQTAQVPESKDVLMYWSFGVRARLPVADLGHRYCIVAWKTT